MKTSFGQLVERLVQSGVVNEYDLLADFFEELEGRAWEEVQAILYDTVLNEIRRELRNIHTRNSSTADRERRSAGSITIRRQAIKTPDLTGPLAFLDLDVVLGDGPKKYGALTLKDHLRVITDHTAIRTIADRTVHRHEWAVGVLTRHRTTCLNDIDRGTLASELPFGGISL